MTKTSFQADQQQQQQQSNMKVFIVAATLIAMSMADNPRTYNPAPAYQPTPAYNPAPTYHDAAPAYNYGYNVVDDYSG
jgi:hypothetical protein